MLSSAAIESRNENKVISQKLNKLKAAPFLLKRTGCLKVGLIAIYVTLGLPPGLL